MVRRRSAFVAFVLNSSVQFNILWLSPEAPETFPRGLLNAMEDDAYALAPLAVRQRALDDIQARTRLDMEAAALQPLQPLDDINEAPPASTNLNDKAEESYDEDTVTRAGEFLRLPVSRSFFPLNSDIYSYITL
jgi:hypothetical protein